MPLRRRTAAGGVREWGHAGSLRRPGWGMATIRDKMGPCLHGFFTSPATGSWPSTGNRELDTSHHEVPDSRESAEDPHFPRVRPTSALTLGAPATRMEFGVAAGLPIRHDDSSKPRHGWVLVSARALAERRSRFSQSLVKTRIGARMAHLSRIVAIPTTASSTPPPASSVIGPWPPPCAAPTSRPTGGRCRW
jgi:hypothetical protein